MTVEALAGPDERLPEEAAGPARVLRPRATTTLRPVPSACG